MECAHCSRSLDVAAHVRAVIAASALTEKEKVVAHLVIRGHTLPEIAAMLGNKVKTMKCHVAAIYEKMGVESRWDFFAKVFGLDAVPMPDLTGQVWHGHPKRGPARRPAADPSKRGGSRPSVPRPPNSSIAP